MKYLCSSCERLVVPARVLIHHARVEITCPKCGASEVLEGSPARSGSEAPATATTGPPCPKCGEPRRGGAACPKCGLVYEKWRPDPDEEPPEHLVHLWKQIESRWDSDDLHDSFVRAAFDAEALSFAARCYRSRDDERAAKQLDKLTTLGVQAMRGAEAPTAMTPRIGRIIGWVTFVLLCLTLATLALLAAGGFHT